MKKYILLDDHCMIYAREGDAKEGYYHEEDVNLLLKELEELRAEIRDLKSRLSF